MANFVASHWYDFNLPLDNYKEWEIEDIQEYLKTLIKMDIRLTRAVPVGMINRSIKNK